MKTTINKGCLYCGLQLPEHADYCPECGRPIEVVTRFDREVKKMGTTIVKGCLYCGLRLPGHADFCPECGRPIERGRITHATQESASDCPAMESKGKDDLERQHEASSDCSNPLTHETNRMGDEHGNQMYTLMLARGNG